VFGMGFKSNYYNERRSAVMPLHIIMGISVAVLSLPARRMSRRLSMQTICVGKKRKVDG